MGDDRRGLAVLSFSLGFACFVLSQFSFRKAFCFLCVLISLSVSLCFSVVRLWTFKCITLLFEQSNWFVLWTFVGEASMKYRLQTASVKHNSGLQETALQGAELNCLTAPCIIFRQSLTTWSRVWRIAKVVLQGEVQRMGTNVSISMKDFWVNYFFLWGGDLLDWSSGGVMSGADRNFYIPRECF